MDALIGEKGIRRLAEMEHGRWNAERLARGWSYGEVKDVAIKQSPYIVSWLELPEHIKQYDYAAVRNWPEVFSAAGLEIYRLSEADTPGSNRRETLNMNYHPAPSMCLAVHSAHRRGRTDGEIGRKRPRPLGPSAHSRRCTFGPRRDDAHKQDNYLVSEPIRKFLLDLIGGG